MITKEEIQAALNAYYGNDVEHGWMAREQMEAAITAAFAAMPGPAVKVEYASRTTGGFYPPSALTPAPDLASENERLRAAIAAYVGSVNGEPEKDIWDTEDGKPSEGADRTSSDWAWKEYDDKKQAAFDALESALERT